MAATTNDPEPQTTILRRWCILEDILTPEDMRLADRVTTTLGRCVPDVPTHSGRHRARQRTDPTDKRAGVS